MQFLFLLVFSEYYRLSNANDKYLGMDSSGLRIVNKWKRMSFVRVHGNYANYADTRIKFKENGKWKILGLENNQIKSVLYPGKKQDFFDFILTDENDFILHTNGKCIVQSNNRLKLGTCKNAVKIIIENPKEILDVLKSDVKKTKYVYKDKLLLDLINGTYKRNKEMLNSYSSRKGHYNKSSQKVTEWYIQII